MLLHYVRATSHTRLRARDPYTSSTLTSGKGGAGLSSLLTAFEGQRCMCLGSSLAKIVEQRAIKNRVQYIHCR
jgi:hypothetical protein